MPSAASKVIEQALALPERERSLMARDLILSLEEGEDDPQTEAAWQTEIAQRLEDIRGGRVTCLAWDTVRNRITERIVDKA
ncbi:MAG: addiction module protein [Magnetococcales bacterium]|nr:addiction module protein [Magnetococcales bacterium]